MLLRYDCWNLCVRSLGEPSPESPIRGGGVWEIGLKGPPTQSCNGSRAPPSPRKIWVSQVARIPCRRGAVTMTIIFNEVVTQWKLCT